MARYRIPLSNQKSFAAGKPSNANRFWVPTPSMASYAAGMYDVPGAKRHMRFNPETKEIEISTLSGLWNPIFNKQASSLPTYEDAIKSQPGLAQFAISSRSKQGKDLQPGARDRRRGLSRFKLSADRDRATSTGIPTQKAGLII